MHPTSLSSEYHRVRQVGSFQQLVSTPFRDGINAMYWPRKLPGDFGEVIRHLSLSDAGDENQERKEELHGTRSPSLAHSFHGPAATLPRHKHPRRPQSDVMCVQKCFEMPGFPFQP